MELIVGIAVGSLLGWAGTTLYRRSQRDEVTRQTLVRGEVIGRAAAETEHSDEREMMRAGRRKRDDAPRRRDEHPKTGK